jgi:TPR repeat protein
LLCAAQTARDGDANSMVRLAKMYLHGQGCQQNIAMAQEWVRRAR